MSGARMVWVAGALALVACAKRPADPPAANAGTAGGAMAMAATDTSAVGSRQAVYLTGAQANAMGVTYLTVGRDSMSRQFETVGEVEAPEPTLATITIMIECLVVHLLVN